MSKRIISAILTVMLMVMSVTVLFPVNVSAAGTTYYIDSVSGNDSNNGTSTSTPWKTAANVNNRTFQPGDKILFKAGSVFNGIRFAPLGSGAAGNPITIDMYGTGNKPIFNGNGVINECLYLNNQQYWTIKNLEITNNAAVDAGNRRGIFIRGENGGVLNSIYITDCDIHDIKGVVWGSIMGRGDQYTCGGIMVWIYGSGYCKFNDLRIENCNFWHSTGMAINMQSDYAAASLSDNSRKSTNVVIKNIYTSDIGASAIIIGDCTGLLVDHVATMDNGFYTDDYRIGVMVPNFEIRTYDCVYQYCEVARQPMSNDGMAWDVDWGNGGTHYYQYNYSHENPNGVYMLCNVSEASQGCTVIFRYNISQNDGTGKFRASAGSATNDLFYNNTIYNEEGGIEVSGTSKWKFYNNIFYILGSANYGSSTYDYNCYYGHTGPASDTHKVTGDPKFAYPGRADDGIATADAYKLLTGSSCINTGMVIANNGGKDFFGNTLYSGAPDIGAHEVTAGEAAPQPRRAIISYNDDQTGTGLFKFQYSGTWSQELRAYGYENDSHSSTQTDAYALFQFTGTKIRLYATKTTASGIAGISIDNGPETLVDFYNAGSDTSWIPTRDDALVYTSPALTAGITHTIKVRVTGTKGKYSTGNLISIDRVRVNDGVAQPKPVNSALNKAASADSSESANPAINATDGNGATRWCAADGNMGHWLKVDLGQSYNLTGTKVLWEQNQIYKYKIETSLDNTNWTTVADRTGNTVYISSSKDNFTATGRYIRLTVTGISNGKWASVWDMAAYGTPAGQTVTTINDNTTGTGNNQFEYVGTWNYNTYGVSSNYNGDEHWSNTANAYINFRFSGTQVKLYGIKDSNEGIAAISINGGAETNVDFYNASRQYQTLVYTSPVLTAGQHTIKIRLTGTKNASSTGTVLSVDKMEVTP